MALPANRVIGNWSVRPARYTIGVGFDVYPKGERSHWSRKASLYPASDGQCFVISMSNQPMDARPSLDEALQVVIDRLDSAKR